MLNVLTLRRARAPRLAAVCGVLVLALGGCEYAIQPLKGLEGRTQVYAAVGRDGAPNAGIVLTSIGAIVIDPPLSPEIGGRLNGDALRRSVIFWDELHRNRKEAKRTQAPPVLYVLHTTYRASHSFGNQVFAGAADIIATDASGRKMADGLEGRRMREILANEFKVPGLENQASYEPTITYEGSLTIHSPEVEIQNLSLGDCVGEGDAAVYLPQQKILFAGDLVLVGFIPYFKGRTPTVGNWIAALKRLEKMDVDTVVPGHGAPGGKELLRQQREFLEALLAEVRRAVSAGRTAEQAAQEVKLPNFAAWRNYAPWFSENVKLVHRELTEGGSGAKPQASSGGAGMAAPKGVEPLDAYRDK